MLARLGITLLVALVFVLVTGTAALAQTGTDATGRATGYWEAYEKACATPFAPYTNVKVDQTGRCNGYWEAYEKACATPFAPYTNVKVDQTGRCTGYWEAYEKAYTR